MTTYKPLWGNRSIILDKWVLSLIKNEEIKPKIEEYNKLKLNLKTKKIPQNMKQFYNLADKHTYEGIDKKGYYNYSLIQFYANVQ